MGAHPDRPGRPGPADPDRRRPRRVPPGLVLTLTAVLLAAVIGCALAAAAFYSWRVQGEVNRLKAQVCLYRFEAEGIIRELDQLGAGLPAVFAQPPPGQCPP